MSNSLRLFRGSRLLAAASIFGLAACLRPAITAVGPLLPDIEATTGLSYASLGALGSLPLLLFSAVAPLAVPALRRAGPVAVARWIVLLLVVGIVIRSIAGVPGLWLGTIALASAVAVGNVLVPVLVRRNYAQHAAVASGVNALVITAFAALGSGLAVTFTGWTGDWRYTLALWALPAALIGGLWWLRQESPSEFDPLPPDPHTRLLRSRTAWAVMFYMGLQSLTFYVFINWMPSIELDRGIGADRAAFHLLLYQLVGAPFGLVVSWVLHRTGRYRLVARVTSVPMLVGAIGLLATDGNALPWLLVAAPGSAAALSVALLLMAHQARDAREAAGLSAMANSGGYLIAACGPVLAGVLHEVSSSWTPALILVVVAAGAQCLVALPATRRRAGAHSD